ncbi:sodium/potassium-transporting ATPase subunit beta-1-interacting protein 3-like [Gouania willdenowi]|uniref:Sodium/potassium-transporting ATPase subunit beta-1-interacting protein n=1 Tax=Gouania willdenowi TaxID=441366 RepID=A0A8C5EP86_GOUWI|nr:sodium/potassium-transporting ATPase subunit beta-1-interacting protein 3-like [Gouania willdenowi]XP_028308199.1 sodium/potassium-transporting ATPase subunit beta-1-interacting protein 3-like [Gouania willdenowi]XP_028308200.1 sodium/potassium-transporting ATPase subunit beta-1-interacting protein 3-like [Gouania willdenowi]
MECCSARCALILLCCLQLATTMERQVFDFLGFQWAPIMVNFFQVIMVILGLFGAVQYRTRFVIMYLLWTLLWMGWNVFVSCLYLDLGGLSKESDILSLGLSPHHSWWKDNGPGCESDSFPSAGLQKQPNPELTTVLSCWLEYHYIEILHCVVQLLLSILGFVYACCVVTSHSDDDDSFNFIGDFYHPSKGSQLLF